jgi:hypothetical protein
MNFLKYWRHHVTAVFAWIGVTAIRVEWKTLVGHFDNLPRTVQILSVLTRFHLNTSFTENTIIGRTVKIF